jgi:hypothetical protein
MSQPNYNSTEDTLPINESSDKTKRTKKDKKKNTAPPKIGNISSNSSTPVNEIDENHTADPSKPIISPDPVEENNDISYKRRVYPKEGLTPLVKATSFKLAEGNSKVVGRLHSGSFQLDDVMHPLMLERQDSQDSDLDEFEEAFNAHRQRKNKIRPINEVNATCILLYIGTFLFALTLCYGIVALTQSFACLGPPYLYITHKGSKNIMKFSRDGCLIHEKVLWGVSNEDSDLRGMAFGHYNGKEVLYVADAELDESGILMFGECFEATSLRPFISRVISSFTNPGAKHTYDIAINEKNDIYASFQKSNSVLRFASQTFQSIPNKKNILPIFHFDKNTSHHFINNDTNKHDVSSSKKDKDSKKKKVASNNQDKNGPSSVLTPLSSPTRSSVTTASPVSSNGKKDGKTNNSNNNNNNKDKNNDKKKQKKSDGNKKDDDELSASPPSSVMDPSLQETYPMNLTRHHHSSNNYWDDEPVFSTASSASSTSSSNYDGDDDNYDDEPPAKKKDKKDKKHHDKNDNDDDDDDRKDNHLRHRNDKAHHHHRQRRQLASIKQPDFNELANISEYFSQQYHSTFHATDFYNGTFVQFGFPKDTNKVTNDEGIRAIAWVKNYTEMWIANEELNAVIIVDKQGKYLGDIKIKHPIEIYYDSHNEEHNDVVFISSKKKGEGGVFSFDIETRKQIKSYQSIGMNHPTGIVSYHDVLFVGDQSRNAVITFNITTARVIKLIIPTTKLNGEIEHIILSKC